MARLLIHVEGQTEEDFVNEVLASHLYSHGFESVAARLLGNSRQRNRRGGIKPWPTVKSDIVRHLRQDAGCVATTMVDYYALPGTGDKAWPGRNVAATLPFPQRANHVEASVLADIVADMGDGFNPQRCVPYVVMHEFEGLLFSDPKAFSTAICRPALEVEFQSIRNGFSTPEEINDSPITAPSKRILSLMPEYEKPLFGHLAAITIGLASIRSECPLFDSWMTKLETIAKVRF
jgi:hypothetical protein